MSAWWEILLSVLLGVVALWLVLVFVLWVEQRKHPGRALFRDLLRLAPDVVRLLKRLASDRTVSVGVRGGSASFWCTYCLRSTSSRTSSRSSATPTTPSSSRSPCASRLVVPAVPPSNDTGQEHPPACALFSASLGCPVPHRPWRSPHESRPKLLLLGAGVGVR